MWAAPSGSAPSEMVSYFLSPSCPVGWLVADGSGGTPDLRGEFIRGWDITRGIDGGRQLGSWQEGTEIMVGPSDGGKSNARHYDYRSAVSTSRTVGSYDKTATHYWAPTRPRNIALLACIKG